MGIRSAVIYKVLNNLQLLDLTPLNSEFFYRENIEGKSYIGACFIAKEIQVNSELIFKSVVDQFSYNLTAGSIIQFGYIDPDEIIVKEDNTPLSVRYNKSEIKELIEISNHCYQTMVKSDQDKLPEDKSENLRWVSFNLKVPINSPLSLEVFKHAKTQILYVSKFLKNHYFEDIQQLTRDEFIILNRVPYTTEDNKQDLLEASN